MLEDSGALWLREQLPPPDELPGVHVCGLGGWGPGSPAPLSEDSAGRRVLPPAAGLDLGQDAGRVTGAGKLGLAPQGTKNPQPLLRAVLASPLETDTHPPFATQRARRGLHACRYWGPRTGSRGSACGQPSDPSGTGLLGPGVAWDSPRQK